MVAMMPAAETANIVNTAFSRKVRRVFGLDLHSWEQLMLASLAVAGLIACAVFVTTASVVFLTREENARTKDEFERYKLHAATTIAGAVERANVADQKAAEANAQAARVEQAARWRVIPLDSKARLISSLASGPGGSVTLSWPANDPESLFLTGQLEGVFQAANSQAGRTLWNVVFEPRTYSRAIFWEMRVIGQSAALVAALRRSFSDAGISYSSELIPHVINDSPGMMISGGGLPGALIWVGPKRPPN